jgi:DNA-binding GntR family transcriptional regulator
MGNGNQALRHGDISDQLRDEIAAGRYPVGGRFPNEEELQARFSVGRHSVRRALQTLSEQGLIGRRRKTGTVVRAARPIPHYPHLMEDFRSLFVFAKDTQFEILHTGAVISRGQEGLFAFAGAERRWSRFAGIRYNRTDSSPLCWSEILIPERFAPAIATIRGSSAPIYETVISEHSLRLKAVEQEIRATSLDASIAKRLDVDPESAALRVKRRYVAIDGMTFEISVNLYPADRYSVQTVISV